MKLCKAAASAFGVLALAAALVTPAHAADSLKMTYGFFMNPVEIPGGKTLPAGLYGFKIVDESGPNKVIQVLRSVDSGALPPTAPANAHAFADLAPMPVVATIVGVVDYKNRPGNAPVTYYQSRGGGAAALRAVHFSPDPNQLVVVYPAARAAELAKAVNRPVPSMSSTAMDEASLKSASINLTTADGSSAEVASVLGKPGDKFAPTGQRGGGYDANADFTGSSGEGVTTAPAAVPGAVPSVPNTHAVDIMESGKVVILHEGPTRSPNAKGGSPVGEPPFFFPPYSFGCSDSGVPGIADFRRNRSQPLPDILQSIGHGNLREILHALVAQLPGDT